MKNTVNTNAHTANIVPWKLILLPMLLITLAGCAEVDEDDGDVVNVTPIPTDEVLKLFCEDAGIAFETCILDDPDNPYARSPFDEVQLFEELDIDAPGPKARFYLWGTAQARGPRGLYQYKTALHLHYLYTDSGSELAREQAIRAYRAVLDYFFDSGWFLKDNTGLIKYPINLRDRVGVNLVLPANSPDAGLDPLFGSNLLARQALGEWGYAFDEANELTFNVE